MYYNFIVFDTKKPDCQPRRNCDINKARNQFGFEATTSLETGLYQTIKWYNLANQNKFHNDEK